MHPFAPNLTNTQITCVFRFITRFHLFFLEFQEMGSQDNGRTVTNTNSFSIRDFVLGAREQDIRNNWPFPEKYLEICMKHGVNKLLPPFKSRDNGKYTSHEEHVQSCCAKEDYTHIGINNNSSLEFEREKELIEGGTNLCIDEAISEITKKMSPLSLSASEHKQDDNGLSSDIALHPINTEVHTSNFKCQTDRCDYAEPSTKSSSRKRKKDKRKLKKRSLAEIYAEASLRTLEDIADISGSTSEGQIGSLNRGAPTVMRYVCAQGTTEGRRIVHEINGSMETVGQNYRHNPAESLKLKYLIDGEEEESVPQGGNSEEHYTKAIS